MAGTCATMEGSPWLSFRKFPQILNPRQEEEDEDEEGLAEEKTLQDKSGPELNREERTGDMKLGFKEERAMNGFEDVFEFRGLVEKF